MSIRINGNNKTAFLIINKEPLREIYINTGGIVGNRIERPSMIIVVFSKESRSLDKFSVVGDSIYSDDYRRLMYFKVFVNSNNLSVGELRIIEERSQFCNKKASFIFNDN